MIVVYASFSLLVKTACSQIVGDDDVCDGVEHELHVLGVGSARQVTVDFFLFALVLRHELRLYVLGRFGVVVFALILRKAFPIKKKKNTNNVVNSHKTHAHYE